MTPRQVRSGNTVCVGVTFMPAAVTLLKSVRGGERNQSFLASRPVAHKIHMIPAGTCREPKSNMCGAVLPKAHECDKRLQLEEWKQARMKAKSTRSLLHYRSRICISLSLRYQGVLYEEIFLCGGTLMDLLRPRSVPSQLMEQVAASKTPKGKTLPGYVLASRR